jgi:enamine deaminase RidA (YjgF/YER057c/UK114 family)
MPGKIENRLAEIGIQLPDANPPVANYVPYVIAGSLVFISGQIPMTEGTARYVGKVGDGLSVEDGYAAARLCAINLMAHLRHACDGDLDRVRRVVKLGGFVNCVPEFTEVPAIINGASDLLVEVFGDAGRHARFAVGAATLPLGVAVEVDGVFEIS